MKQGAWIACVLLAGTVLAASACGGSGSTRATVSRTATVSAKTCPQAWRAGWQNVANRAGFPVYCPAWLPSPLTAKIGGPYSSGASIGKDKSYLAGFIWFERGSGEAHVNLRGYPHRSGVPSCVDENQVGKKLVRTRVPCFADPKGTRKIGPYKVTLYTVNRDADQWHLLYLWRRGGSVYALSEHVAPPYGYHRVLQNLDRMMRNLVLIHPSG